MVNKIGKTAGHVWEFLNKSGETTLTQLTKNVEGSTNAIHQAIGWLAREDKLHLVKKGKSLKISVKG